MTIHINNNSDCAGEIEELKALLKRNTGYTAADLTNADIVAIAIDELYDKLIQDAREGRNQRKI